MCKNIADLPFVLCNWLGDRLFYPVRKKVLRTVFTPCKLHKSGLMNFAKVILSTYFIFFMTNLDMNSIGHAMEMQWVHYLNEGKMM